MNIANNWNDYKILDMADGQKLERWGDVVLAVNHIRKIMFQIF